jgi:NADH-quinone oxidoreductase subunit A
MGDMLAAAIYTVLALAAAGSMLAMAQWAGPRRERRGKREPYECGVEIQSSARERFHVRFYLVALVFVLFDIETVFLIPWAVSARGLGRAAMIETAAFIAVLGLGLLYAIRRGIFRWDRD